MGPNRSSPVLSRQMYCTLARAERYAVEVAARGRARGGALSPALRTELATAASAHDPQVVMSGAEPLVADRYEGVDIDLLDSVGSDITAALLVDLSRERRGTASDV